MPRFFIQSSFISDGIITIIGDDYFHISRSLRMKPGEKITVCDECRNEYECILIDISDTIKAEIVSVKVSENEPPYNAVLYQALVKGDKFDTVVQKAVEIGATRIVPVLTSRCMARPDEKSMKNKLERWRRIASEASKQCGRAFEVGVSDCMVFEEAVRAAASADIPLFCYEAGGTESITSLLEKYNAPSEIAVFIGPEGGFDPEEADIAGKSGMFMCGLGKRILRTETASSFVLSCLSYRYELYDIHAKGDSVNTEI